MVTRAAAVFVLAPLPLLFVGDKTVWQPPWFDAYHAPMQAKLYSVVHDLGNALAMLNMSSGLLRTDDGDRELYFEMLEGAIARVREIQLALNAIAEALGTR